MRFLRFLFISLLLFALLSIVWPAASLLLWILRGNSDHQFYLARIWAKTLARLGFIDLVYTGLENFTGLGPCVLVANHPSPLDIVVLLCDIPDHCPGGLRFFAAKQLFFNPFLCFQLRFGTHILGGGKPGRDSIRSVRLAVRLITETGRNLIIFPAALHLHAELHPFQEGAAFIAIKAGVPILPIALSGTRQFMGGTVTVHIGEPIGTAELSVSDRAWLTTCLHDRVSQLLKVAANLSKG
jgi:1-acyl-sn-glycerol-3-phosphate acyltransferase